MGAVLRRLTSAAVLAAPLAVAAGQSAATLYALNCMGCHPPPEGAKREASLRGQFAPADAGRVFFIDVPRNAAARLSAGEEARLMQEILTWKRSCTVILQQAPLVRYSGEKFVK
ncbi:MAG: hypothetical protein AB1768_00475 [Pseudomonadota bacterium]|jgi:hypothetical protein